MMFKTRINYQKIQCYIESTEMIGGKHFKCHEKIRIYWTDTEIMTLMVGAKILSVDIASQGSA